MLHRVKAERARIAFAILLLIPITSIMVVCAMAEAWWGVALVIAQESVVFYCLRNEWEAMKGERSG